MTTRGRLRDGQRRCVSGTKLRDWVWTGPNSSSVLSTVLSPLTVTEPVAQKLLFQTILWWSCTPFAVCQPPKKKRRRERKETKMMWKILEELKMIGAFLFGVCIKHDGCIRWEKMTRTRSRQVNASSPARSVPSQRFSTTTPTSRSFIGALWIPILQQERFLAP